MVVDVKFIIRHDNSWSVAYMCEQQTRTYNEHVATVIFGKNLTFQFVNFSYTDIQYADPG
jgi:hypothetical protein